jgi:hypothetical protein
VTTFDQDLTIMYELHLETIHCIGRLNHVVGTTDTETEAKAWVEGSMDGALKPAPVPKDDPMVWCPVTHGRMRCQKPIRSYGEAT